MPDSQPDPSGLVDPVALRREVRRRGRNIVIGAALLVWVLVIYFAVMLKIDNDIRHPPSAEDIDRAEHSPAAPAR